MLLNYLKTAWRSILRAKGFAILNVAGLAVGIAVCLLILLYVHDELSYDAYHAHAGRIYRVQRGWLEPDGSVASEFCTLAPSFVPLLKSDFKEIETIARTFNPGSWVVEAGENRFTEERLFFVEPEIFDILTVPLLQGDSSTALAEAGSVVLSRSMARKYFGDADPMGQSLVCGELPCQVTGIMEDTPANSHVHFDFLVSYLTLKGLEGSGDTDYFHGTSNFSDNVTSVYARLAAGVDGREFQARIPAFLDRHFPPQADDRGRLVKMSEGETLHFQKVDDIHLYSHTRNELEPNSDARYVFLFAIIALFILGIACINFMNLSTARAVKRAKEVGLRKVVGAARRMLVAQFLGESLLMTAISLVLGVGLAAAALGPFSHFTGHGLGLAHLLSAQGLALVLGGFLVTGLAAGAYPAFYLSSFRPGTILRGELTKGRGGAALRTALVVFQFTISIALIFSILVIVRQMSFLRTADVGFQRDNILLIPFDSVDVERWPDVKTALLQEKSILSATLSKRAPAGRLLDAPGFWAEVRGRKVGDTVRMPHNRVEHDFFRTYRMTFVAGRDFSTEYANDATEAFILNETAVRQLGFSSPQEAVGARLGTFAPDRSGRIIGVVRDFNYESLHNLIVPIVTYIAPRQANTLSLRIAPGSLNPVVRHVQAVIDRFQPVGPITYDFLNDRLAALYRNEERTMKMFTAFSLLAVFIACLGLFGLASFSAERRTKEIGVRKVLGASVPSIAFLLSREFTRWVVAANVIAWPAAFFGMRLWLQSFAYRAPIGVSPFVFSALLAFAIALATVSYQAIASSRSNAVESLRCE